MDRPSHRSQVPAQIVDEASGWFVSMREQSVSSADREAFAEWLKASPVHVRVYLELAELWGDAAFVSEHVDVGMAAGQAAQNVVALRGAIEPPTDEALPHTRRVRYRVALAAVLVIACLFAGGWYALLRPIDYTTEIGEQRILTLEDGSTLKLDSHSEVVLHFSKQQRWVDLRRGQALFQVRHDTSRPFIVSSGSVAIRAVGTQFDVNSNSLGTVVTVVEGRVEVASSGTGQPPPQMRAPSAPTMASQSPGASADEHALPPRFLVSSGEQIRIDAAGTVNAPSKANVVAATSWLQQQIVFEGETLAGVVEEFNRYSRTPIVLADQGLAAMRVNGVFYTTNPESLLRFIDGLDGVEVQRSTGEIRIQRKTDTSR